MCILCNPVFYSLQDLFSIHTSLSPYQVFFVKKKISNIHERFFHSQVFFWQMLNKMCFTQPSEKLSAIVDGSVDGCWWYLRCSALRGFGKRVPSPKHTLSIFKCVLEYDRKTRKSDSTGLGSWTFVSTSLIGSWVVLWKVSIEITVFRRVPTLVWTLVLSDPHREETLPSSTRLTAWQ